MDCRSVIKWLQISNNFKHNSTLQTSVYLFSSPRWNLLNAQLDLMVIGRKSEDKSVLKSVVLFWKRKMFQQ